MADNSSKRGTSYATTADDAALANANAATANANAGAGRANSAADRVEAIEPNLLWLLASTETTHTLGAGDAVEIVYGTSSGGYPIATITFGL